MGRRWTGARRALVLTVWFNVAHTTSAGWAHFTPDASTTWPMVVPANACGMHEIRGGADDVVPSQRSTRSGTAQKARSDTRQ
jgi:hypothetical protein